MQPEASSPSDRRCAVVVCSDANWAWQSAFVLSRSIALDESGLLDHHAYLIGEVSDELLSAYPEAVQVHHLEDYPDAFEFAKSSHVPAASMLRLFALEELSRSYRKVVYLDGDIFQAWGSLSDLLLLPETGRPLAAVRDRSHWFDNPRLREQKTYVKALHPEIGDRYFNSGMLVVDGHLWHLGNYSRKALDFFKAHPERCRYGDQSALNGAVAGNWDSLSPGWNWQMSKDSYPLVAGRRPRLVHFTGSTKPWNDRFRLLDSAIFEDMKRFLRSRGLVQLPDPRHSPDSFSSSMERRRLRYLEILASNPLAKRDLIKQFLDSPLHLDIASGVPGYAFHTPDRT